MCIKSSYHIIVENDAVFQQEKEKKIQRHLTHFKYLVIVKTVKIVYMYIKSLCRTRHLYCVNK